MKRYLFLIVAGLLSAGTGRAQTVADQSKQAWRLSGEGTKQVECYFWSTQTQVSTVACLPLKNPTDELPIVLPVNATDLYHTHPKGFPQLSEADKMAQRKSGIRIHVVYH